MQVMRELRDEKLDFWIKNSFNVLLIGHYGIGKTTRIVQAFERNHLKNCKYFSASTMDPWCDFIGVPKVVEDDKGPYLDYVLPRDLRDDTVEAMFFDEFNRSHKKVRNAVMELLQFKSINGRKFKNLKFIWASINPEGEDYQVEALDKTQKDRFEVIVGVPYEPNLAFFATKFDKRQAKCAINWWQALSEEQQMEVSPRRLEYALRMYNIPGGDIKDVLPHSTNPGKLASLLKTGPVDEKLKDLFKANDLDAAKKYLQVENNYAASSRYLVNHIPEEVNENDWMLFFLQSVSSEKLTAMLANNEAAYKFITNNVDKVPMFARMLRDIINTNTDKILVKRLKKEMDTNKLMATVFGTSAAPTSFDKPYFSAKITSVHWSTRLAGWLGQPMDTTPQRMSIYDELSEWIPRTLPLNEAVDTLEMLNMLAKRCHADTLKSFRHLTGIVNHCIDQINKASTLGWNEILANYGQKFDNLLDKMRTLGYDKKLYCPAKKQPSYLSGITDTSKLMANA